MDASPDPTRARLLEAVSRWIGFDACVHGVGERARDGTIKITDAFVSGLPEAFVQEYAAIADDDVAAQLFSCQSMSVLSVSSAKYPDLSTNKTGSEVGAYLRRHGVKHLLLAGLDSTFGLSWLTLYRMAAPDGAEKPPFDPYEAELASYVIRAALFEWQLGTLKTRLPGEPNRYQMVELSPRLLDVALRKARGLTLKEIALELGVEVSTVASAWTQIKLVLGSRPRLMDRFLGPLPPPRPSRDDKAG